MPVAVLSAGLITTTLIAHCLANCVYSCLCRIVEEYDLMPFSGQDIFGAHHVPWRAATLLQNTQLLAESYKK